MWTKWKLLDIKQRTVERKIAQANRTGVTYFTHQGKKYPFKYESGERRGGKRLLIWDSSEERAEISREIAESVEKRTIKPPISTDNSRLSVFSTASDDDQAEALRKQHAIKEFLKAKEAKLEVKKFIKSYNDRFPETELTQRKLYHWIALYKENGLVL